MRSRQTAQIKTVLHGAEVSWTLLPDPWNSCRAISVYQQIEIPLHFMKTLLWTAFILSSAAVALPLRATNNSENPKQATFLGLVVAETIPHDSPAAIGSASAIPSLVIDGGYIEGGDPIAGDRAPTPMAVAAAVSSALRTHGFSIENGQATASPVQVLTYHWGVLRRRHWRDISLSNLNSNLKARLSLVARYDTVRDLEQYLLADRAMHGASHAVLDQPTYLDARQNAEDPRYFVILTAYDLNALKNRQAVPLWRVKLSALENTGSMANVVPALAAASGPYLGQNLSRPESVRVPENASVATQEQNGQSYALTADSTNGLDQAFLGKLLKHEHTQFAGEDQTEWDETSWGRK